MPVSPQMIQAMQVKYQNSMRTLQKEAKGGKLRGFAEQAVGKGNEEVIFYRSEEGTVFKGDLDMFDASTWNSTAGKINKFSTKINYVYWSHKIKEAELNSTNLSADSQLLKSGINSLKLSEDVDIMDKIKASSGLATAGSSTTTITNNLDELVGTAKLSILAAKEAVDTPKNTAMVMNRKAYKELFSTDLAKNNDYIQMSGAGGDVAVRFYGTTVITLPDIHLPDKAIFFVPSMSFGFAAWENGVSSNSQFMPWDDSLWLVAKSSLGVVVLDPESIVKFSYQ